jgi:hypothetical protein
MNTTYWRHVSCASLVTDWINFAIRACYSRCERTKFQSSIRAREPVSEFIIMQPKLWSCGSKRAIVFRKWDTLPVSIQEQDLLNGDNGHRTKTRQAGARFVISRYGREGIISAILKVIGLDPILMGYLSQLIQCGCITSLLQAIPPPPGPAFGGKSFYVNSWKAPKRVMCASTMDTLLLWAPVAYISIRYFKWYLPGTLISLRTWTGASKKLRQLL